MAKTKFTVQTEVGTFTRTTARPYAYLVVSRDLNETWVRKYFTSELAYNRKMEKEYAAVVAGGPTQYESQRASYPKYLEGVRDEIATYETRLAARLVLSANSKFIAQRWTSRIDLARTHAATLKSTGYMDVKIFDVATGQEAK